MMSDSMKKNIASVVAGAVFAVGLGVSGMTNADKVIGFLNLAGDWDPSLAFVMIGAISVHLVLYRVILRRPSPLFHDIFHIPTSKDIDRNLVIGSAVFGLGWGLGGYCPGPGLVSLASLFQQGGWEKGASALTFVIFMLVGMTIHKFVAKRTSEKQVTIC